MVPANDASRSRLRQFVRASGPQVAIETGTELAEEQTYGTPLGEKRAKPRYSATSLLSALRLVRAQISKTDQAAKVSEAIISGNGVDLLVPERCHANASGLADSSKH